MLLCPFSMLRVKKKKHKKDIIVKKLSFLSNNFPILRKREICVQRNVPAFRSTLIGIS